MPGTYGCLEIKSKALRMEKSRKARQVLVLVIIIAFKEASERAEEKKRLPIRS